jgi:hypothetical protein
VRARPVAISGALLALWLAVVGLLPARPAMAETPGAAPGTAPAGRPALVRRAEPWTTSYYMRTVDPVTGNRLGCALAPRLAGSAEPESVVILDYARPRQWTGPDGQTVYGASIWNLEDRYPNTRQIAASARSLMEGYVECTPRGDSSPRLLVVVGTSNHGRQVTPEHGRAWAAMVNDLGDYLRIGRLADRVAVAGGSDMELAYNTPAVTRAWVDAYHDVGQWPLVNFGDAAGCPTRGTTARPGRCDDGWTQEDIWYVSWGSPLARAMPQIYATAGGNAAAWQQLVLYATLAHPAHPPMRIDAVLTQRQAVEQVCRDTPSAHGCWGVENTPEQGWLQLSARLIADPRTAGAGLRMRSTDIRHCYDESCPP